ncbi:MAG: hypothetical protein WBJ87_05700 [Candidatus Hydrothermia bacterium]
MIIEKATFRPELSSIVVKVAAGIEACFVRYECGGKQRCGIR